MTAFRHSAALDRLAQDDPPARSISRSGPAVLVSALLTMTCWIPAPAAPSARCGADISRAKPSACRRRTPSFWCSFYAAVLAACPAGSTRISSARQSDAVRRAGRHRISVHRGGRGAGYVWGGVLGAGIVVILKEILQSYLPYIFGARASSKPSCSASSWSACCNWRRPASGPG